MGRTIVILVARLIFAAVFAMAVSFKFAGMANTAAYIAAAGLPFPLLLAWLAAIFEVGVYDYDKAFVVMPIEDAQTLLLLGDVVSMIEVETVNADRVGSILEPLAAVGAVSFAFGKDTPQDEGENNWVSASDHGAFHDAGVPFLYIGVDYHTDYHRPSDDFERIKPDVFTSATALAIAGFRALDRSLDR